MMRFSHYMISAVLGAVVLVTAQAASACPFCSAPSRTLGEELAAADIVLLAKLVEPGKIGDGTGGIADQRGESKFEITDVIKGNEHLGGAKRIEVFHFGDPKVGSMFLITGMVLPETKWATPIPLSDRGVKYVSTLLTLPEKGVERLKFFQDYFEDQETLMAQDAYDEFARASFNDVRAMKDHLQHDKLVGWVNDLDVAQGRRRLYLTLLGVCGQQDDAQMLEQMLLSDDRRARAGLDALIGCYLMLKGPEGLTLVEKLFLIDKKSEYADTYGTIMALRVIGEETDLIGKPRLLQSIRLMLDRPDLADLIIPDLARWEDWSAMDRLIDLFKNTEDGSNFVRVPVVNYLDAAARQPGEVGKKAAAALDELTLIDGEAVKRARAYSIFGAMAAPKPTAKTDQEKPKGDAAKSGEKSDEGKTKPDQAPTLPADPAPLIAPKSAATKPAAPKPAEAAPPGTTVAPKSAAPAPGTKSSGVKSSGVKNGGAKNSGTDKGAQRASAAPESIAATHVNVAGEVDLARTFGAKRIGLLMLVGLLALGGIRFLASRAPQANS